MKGLACLPGVICACTFQLPIALLLIAMVQSATAAPVYNIVPLGLDDLEHTASNGYKECSAYGLNEAGQVSGYSYRYNGGSTELGQDAWLYDPLLDQTFSLNLSTRSDGYAFSRADYLGEDGLTLGTYYLYDTFDNVVERPFYFTTADGLHDLGSLVEGGLAANGWDSLAYAIRTNGLGQILGNGKLTSQPFGQMAYLLTPVPPLPGDVNFDGLVNMFDLNLLSVHWGGTGPAGDANGDGMINIFDINLMTSDWTPDRRWGQRRGRARTVSISAPRRGPCVLDRVSLSQHSAGHWPLTKTTGHVAKTAAEVSPTSRSLSGPSTRT